MRGKIIISAISAIAVAAIVGALVIKHRFPLEAASARRWGRLRDLYEEEDRARMTRLFATLEDELGVFSYRLKTI